jgi:phosphate transport system protein
MDEKEKFKGSIRFKELMEKTYSRVEKLSAATGKMIDRAIIALSEDDEELYEELYNKYTKIRGLRVKLEKSVVNSVALHQPFASDLRFLISSLKIANEIERIARDAVHIANTSIFFDRSMSCLSNPLAKTIQLAKKAQKMYDDSILLFLNRKEADIEEWTEVDDKVDELHSKLIDEITDQMVCNTDSTRAGVSLILSTRYIERIADRACNICEESNYIITGKREAID